MIGVHCWVFYALISKVEQKENQTQNPSMILPSSNRVKGKNGQTLAQNAKEEEKGKACWLSLAFGLLSDLDDGLLVPSCPVSSRNSSCIWHHEDTGCRTCMLLHEQPGNRTSDALKTQSQILTRLGLPTWASDWPSLTSCSASLPPALVGSQVLSHPLVLIGMMCAQDYRNLAVQQAATIEHGEIFLFLQNIRKNQIYRDSFLLRLMFNAVPVQTSHDQISKQDFLLLIVALHFFPHIGT